MGFVASFAVMFGFMTAYSWVKGREPLSWTNHWLTWVIVLGAPILLAATVRGERLSAGADWLIHGGTFLKTYELEFIQAEQTWNGSELNLLDLHGNRIEVKIRTLQFNPELWDLVYNGILHSVANGARVNDIAIEELQLHEIVEMRDRPPGP